MTQEKSEKYQAIIHATLELVAEQGFHGTPMSQVAQQAGVGVGSIYRYFKDKNELIHAVHSQVESGMFLGVANPVTGDTKKEQFKSLVQYLAKHFISNPLEFRFLEQYYNSPYGIEKKREKFLNEKKTDPCAEVFHRIVSGDEIKDYPKSLIHSLAFGPLMFTIRDHLAGLHELDEDLIGKIAEGCWDAIRKSKKK